MNAKDFLNQVCDQIKYKPARMEISNELGIHISELKDEYINTGMNELEAEEKAISQMGPAKVIGKQLNKVHKPKLNWQILLLVVLLTCFGIVSSIFKQNTTYKSYLGNTIIYMLCGFLISLGIYFYDYKRAKKYSNIIYLVATIIMVLPFTRLGLTLNSKNLIRIFNIAFSPCTISVPLYIIAFSGYISKYNKSSKINQIKIFLLAMFSILLMYIQHSYENAIILSIIYLILTTLRIIYCKTAILRKLLLLYGFALIFLSTLIIVGNMFVKTNINFKYKDEQINTIRSDILEHSKLIGESESQIFKDNELLIINESNYTFLYLLGKGGIVISIVLAVSVILTNIILTYNTKKIKEDYGKYLTVGLSLLFIVESTANILMNLMNINTLMDVSLPFVTYGSVDFLTNCFMVSIILSIYRRKNINLYDKMYEKSQE